MTVSTAISKKQQQILATARSLFWKHGFKRVSIEEICADAEVSKMTFYRFFANKAELAKAVFDKEANDGLTRFRQILTEPCDPAERIRKMIMMKVEGAHEISREFLQDFYGDRELGLKSHIEKRTQEMWVTIVDEFKDAQRKGYFRADFKPEFLLFFSQRMGEWISDERLLGLYPSPQALVMELIKFVSYGITPRAEEGVAAHDNRNLRL